jgi:hypothetical protein
MQDFEVANYPHKILQWEEFMSKAMGKKVIMYNFALGLTMRHPDLRNNCYFTVRNSYKMIVNNQPAFLATGESVYKIKFRQRGVTEELLLELMKHAHHWFVKEFNERKDGSILHFTEEPAFIIADVLPAIRESLKLAGYI